MGEQKTDPMDVDAVVEKLRSALVLQYRSALQFTIMSGSLFGLEYQSLCDRLWLFARSELEDARLLVEKLAALGCEPATDVAPLRWTGEAPRAVDGLIESETEVIDALHRLAPRQREVLVLRYWSHLSEAEIARTLGISQGTVKSTASRALVALEKALGTTRTSTMGSGKEER